MFWKREMEEIEQGDEVESAEDTLTHFYFMNFSQLPSMMKEKEGTVHSLGISRVTVKISKGVKQ